MRRLDLSIRLCYLEHSETRRIAYFYVLSSKVLYNVLLKSVREKTRYVRYHTIHAIHIISFVIYSGISGTPSVSDNARDWQKLSVYQLREHVKCPGESNETEGTAIPVSVCDGTGSYVLDVRAQWLDVLNSYSRVYHKLSAPCSRSHTTYGNSPLGVRW